MDLASPSPLKFVNSLVLFDGKKINKYSFPVTGRGGPKCCETSKLTGSVLDAERSGRLSKLKDEKLLDTSDSMLRSPSESLRKLAQEEDIVLPTAHEAVRKQLKLLKKQ
jgi:hypothetical protein